MGLVSFVLAVLKSGRDCDGDLGAIGKFKVD